MVGFYDYTLTFNCNLYLISIVLTKFHKGQYFIRSVLVRSKIIVKININVKRQGQAHCSIKQFFTYYGYRLLVSIIKSHLLTLYFAKCIIIIPH